MAVVRSRDYLQEVVGEERTEYTRVLAGMPLWAPLRVAVRMVCVLGWTLGAFALSKLAALLGVFSRSWSKRARRAVSRRWISLMPALLGVRVTVEGRVPNPPFFIVNNHITWIDFLVVAKLCPSRAVVMDEMVRMPVMGTLFAGLDPIPTRRIAEDTPACLAEMAATLRRGESLMLAPEGNISPGHEVRRFRGRLFEAAVRCHFPVHYASLTYRTPRGCPPANERVLFGPDPHYPWPDGKIPEKEFEGWGTQRNFLSHVIHLLALPHSEAVMRFGREPIFVNDAVQLANSLQQAVTAIFTPVQGHPAKATTEKTSSKRQAT